MVLTSPRIFGTPRRPGDRLVTVWLAATVLLTFAASADAQSANSRPARLSQDLAQLVATHGDFKPTDVILTASQEKVDRLAARHLPGVRRRAGLCRDHARGGAAFDLRAMHAALEIRGTHLSVLPQRRSVADHVVRDTGRTVSRLRMRRVQAVFEGV